MKRISRLEPRKLFWLLLLVTFLKGAVWSIVVPIWEANDEDQHFGYAQEVDRQRTLRVQLSAQITEERLLAWNLASPLKISYQREPIDLSPESMRELDSLKARLASPDVQTNLVPLIWFPGFVRQHPPLYYGLQAIVHRIGAARTILVRLSWMRLASVLMGLAALACAYAAARELFPQQEWFALQIVTLMSFHPLFTFFTSVVNNQALELLCVAALIWSVVLIARRGMTWKRGAVLGCVVAAGLLTRASFVAMLPLVIALLGWNVRREKKNFNWAGWGLVVLLPLLLAGWWYGDLFQAQSPLPREVFAAPPAEVPSASGSIQQTPSFFGYVLSYPWSTSYNLFLHEWWGAFGWRDTVYPSQVYYALDALTFFAFLGLGWGVWRWNRSRGVGHLAPRWTTSALGVALGIGATLCLIVFYNGLDFIWQTSGGYKIVGRYFLAAIAPQIMMLAIGWKQIHSRWMLQIICLAMIALNLYTLLGVLVPRYYREQIVARYEPTDQPIKLALNSVRRIVTVPSHAVSRVDLWLSKSQPNENSAVTISAASKTALQINIPYAQMLMPYPTILRFEPLPRVEEFALEVRAASGGIGLSADGQVAVKAYETVPLREIPARISFLQPYFYTPRFILAVGVAFALILGIFLFAFLRACLSDASTIAETSRPG